MGVVMRALSDVEVHRASVDALGLDPNTVDLCKIEALACCLRRAAGFLCPCSSRTLVHAVAEPLWGLVDNLEELRRTVEDVLEALVAHGDIHELLDASQEASNGRRSLLYLAPPTFVRRQGGAVIILGLLPDGMSLLPEEIEEQIEYFNHVRLLPSNKGVEFVDQLIELGFIELSSSAWLKLPEARTASEHLSTMNRLLKASPITGDGRGLVLLDPGRSVQYYKGRWVEPVTHNGLFIGRR